MYVENRLNIHTKAFEEILEEESKLREEKSLYQVGSQAWNRVWDRLDKVLKRKRNYENKVRNERW